MAERHPDAARGAGCAGGDCALWPAAVYQASQSGIIRWGEQSDAAGRIRRGAGSGVPL